MNTVIYLLMGAPGGKQEWYQFVPLILIVVIFYFFMIRPQVKKQKEAKKFLETIKKGDKVVTIGGIHGKIHEVQDTALIVEIADGVRVKVLKSAISMDGSAALNQS